MMHKGLACVALMLATAAQSQLQSIEDAAKAFGARESMGAAALSPDGTKIAFVGPSAGQGSVLYTLTVAEGATPKVALRTTGNPERLYGCDWVSNTRLACQIGGLQAYNDEIYGFNSVIAVDADGANVKALGKKQGQNALFLDMRGGGIIDYIPGEDGSVLMTRAYVPEANVNSLISKSESGMGVDKVNTITGSSRQVETPRDLAVDFITDGRGALRIQGMATRIAGGYQDTKVTYSYRVPGDRDWQPLSVYDFQAEDGFEPYAVDATKNISYGFRKIDGRKALVSVALDGSKAETILVKRGDVDVDGLIRVGRERRVVGASFATEKRQSVYFDPDLKKLAASLGKALPGQPLIEFVDANQDETRLLIWAGGDTAPGTYYLFDKATKKLQPIMQARPQLAGYTLAAVKPISYPARDGTIVPAYLTLPPGSSGKNLPAIVMPHGGPSARDEWGFDWLPQFFANRGFAVIQPNYRGSSGYGDAWFQQNGFQSWRTAIGDVADAGKWLVKDGIADPARLTVVGWSYGGYAALQAAAVEPALFKKVVAIAPVTDLAELKREKRNFGSRRINEQFIGTGPHITEGSPAQNAGAITAPVLLVHGDMDRNVRIRHSQIMADKLKAAGKAYELVEYPGLEHSLVDSTVRAELLKKTASFLLGK